MPYLSSLVSPVSTVSSNTDANPAPVKISSTDDSIAEIAFYLGKLVKMSEALAVVDTNQRQRVAVETFPASPNVRLVDSNINAFVYANGANSFATTNPPFYTVPDVWKIIDAARQNYQTSIRSNLSFS